MKRPSFFYDADDAAPGGSTLLSAPAAPAAPADAGTTPAPAAAPAPAATPAWVNEDGSLAPGWIDRLPEDLRSNATLRTVTTLPDLAKSLVHTKGMIGKKLSAPATDATPEELANWRKTVGAPETPEGYYSEQVKSYRPEAVPEEMWDGNSEKEFLAIAHKHHLPPGAVQDIMNFYGGYVKNTLDASQGQQGDFLKAEGDKLRQAWGKDYDVNLSTAARMAQTVGLPLDHAALTDATVVQALAKMGRLISEDKMIPGTPTSISGSIDAKAREITDPNSNSQLARDYRGENGPERQIAAQKQLHELKAAAGQQ